MNTEWYFTLHAIGRRTRAQRIYPTRRSCMGSLTLTTHVILIDSRGAQRNRRTIVCGILATAVQLIALPLLLDLGLEIHDDDLEVVPCDRVTLESFVARIFFLLMRDGLVMLARCLQALLGTTVPAVLEAVGVRVAGRGLVMAAGGNEVLLGAAVLAGFETCAAGFFFWQIKKGTWDWWSVVIADVWLCFSMYSHEGSRKREKLLGF